MIKTLNLEGIGDVKFTKNRRYRNLKITVRPSAGVNVLVPELISFSDAEKFVFEKQKWIRNSVEKMRRIADKRTIFDAGTGFQTREHRLSLVPHDKSTLGIIIKNRVIYVFYPAFADVKDERVQQCIRKAITEAWRIEAKVYLPQRVKELAVKFGFTYRSVAVKNAGTRWGSCSATNNINLNVQLMRLPSHLCDYIILHELTHTVEKNHGRNFWALLDKVTGNARTLDKELRKYCLKNW
ncbi:MAG: M48 family metallopeptidase [Bacteroidales bacterium]|nr:M48 family metallopeptidase [Bacteroidales bacterium]